MRGHCVPLRWAEQRACDTNERTRYSVARLQADGTTLRLLVTHGVHQQRGLAGFERAIAGSWRAMALVSAPVGRVPSPAGQVSGDLPGDNGLRVAAGRCTSSRAGWRVSDPV